MKKPGKKAVKPAKKAAKNAKKSPEHKTVKSVVKAVLGGDRLRGLKVEVNSGTKIATLSYGHGGVGVAFPCDADVMLAEVFSALGVKVVKTNVVPKGL